MKVSELTGAQLDYWVAMAESLAVRWPVDGRPVLLNPEDGIFAMPYQPSSQWVDGGPIIERTHIGVSFIPGTPDRDDLPAFWSGDLMLEKLEQQPEGDWANAWVHGYGETPLVAAMRAYVASKFGDEVAQEGTP